MEGTLPGSPNNCAHRTQRERSLSAVSNTLWFDSIQTPGCLDGIEAYELPKGHSKPNYGSIISGDGDTNACSTRLGSLDKWNIAVILPGVTIWLQSSEMK